MATNDTPPWIWLGFDEIYIRWPGQALWESLSDEGVPWAARLPLSGGQDFLRCPGQKLGIEDSNVAMQLDGLILKQLIEKIGESPIIFAPPRQIPALQKAAEKLIQPPHAILLDSSLMVNQKTVSLRPPPHQGDIYLFDWTKSNQGIMRQFIKNQTFFYKTLLSPVLMTVDAYSAGRAEIFSQYQGQKSMISATATLYHAQPIYKGIRPIGLGLVWAWGFGVNMWQWALKPIPLPNADSWSFECLSSLKCRIQIENGKSKEFALLPPVMKAYFSAKTR
jgi:hypothetical protein